MHDEVFVMDASEGFAGDFINLKEVVQLCGGVVLAAVTIALWLDWAEIFFVFCVLDIDATVERIKGAIASLAGWADTVEGVAAVEYAIEEVAWFAAHAKKMAWFILRQDFVGEFDDIWGFVLGSI